MLIMCVWTEINQVVILMVVELIISKFIVKPAEFNVLKIWKKIVHS